MGGWVDLYEALCLNSPSVIIKPLLIIVPTPAGLVVAQEMVIGTIGNRTAEGDGRFGARENLGRNFYLSNNAPATASGTVSSIQYCYTLDTDNLDDIEIFLSTVGFYRLVGSNYTLVNSTVISVKNIADELPENIRDTFDCVEISVPEFEVERGDVIGVCQRLYPDDGSSPRTERVTVVANVNSESVLRSRGGDTDDRFCSEIGVMPSTLAVDQLDTRDGRIIRVSANISKHFLLHS